MFLTRCPVCKHVNPEHSKFCNACGVSLLRLGVCARCGALNELAAATCHQCSVSLRPADPPAQSTESQLRATQEAATPGPETPATDKAPVPHSTPAGMPATKPPAQVPAEPAMPSHPARKRLRLSTVQRWLIACSAVTVALASLGYLAHRELAVVDVAGLLPNAPRAVDMPARAPSVQKSSATTWAIDDLPPAPRTDRDPAAATETNPPSAGPYAGPAEPQTADFATANSARPGRTERSSETERGQHRTAVQPAPRPHSGPCTAAIAALGLCTVESTATKE